MAPLSFVVSWAIFYLLPSEFKENVCIFSGMWQEAVGSFIIYLTSPMHNGVTSWSEMLNHLRALHRAAILVWGSLYHLIGEMKRPKSGKQKHVLWEGLGKTGPFFSLLLGKNTRDAFPTLEKSCREQSAWDPRSGSSCRNRQLRSYWVCRCLPTVWPGFSSAC